MLIKMVENGCKSFLEELFGVLWISFLDMKVRYIVVLKDYYFERG